MPCSSQSQLSRATKESTDQSGGTIKKGTKSPSSNAKMWSVRMVNSATTASAKRLITDALAKNVKRVFDATRASALSKGISLRNSFVSH